MFFPGSGRSDSFVACVGKNLVSSRWFKIIIRHPYIPLAALLDQFPHHVCARPQVL